MRDRLLGSIDDGPAALSTADYSCQAEVLGTAAVRVACKCNACLLQGKCTQRVCQMHVK